MQVELISIVIPTYNGVHKIAKLLDSLLYQTVQNFEIVVSIDGSTDGTLEYLKNRKKDFNNFIILSNLNSGRSICRNKGANAANGTLLVFLDDDMRATPNLIEQHILMHQKYVNSIVVGGQMEEIDACNADIQLYKAYLSRKWSETTDEKAKTPYITAANFSISKSLFIDLGMFDERLTDAEDYHLAVLAFENNVDIYFKPDLLAWHDDFISCKSYIKRLREYQVAQMKLSELFPNLYKLKYQFRNKPELSTVKKIVYSFFAQEIWIKLIDLDYLKILPKFLKYRIYDYVITGSIYKK